MNSMNLSILRLNPHDPISFIHRYIYVCVCFYVQPQDQTVNVRTLKFCTHLLTASQTNLGI